MIGDAAIEILGSKGSKGLTHRAVDQHLNWPEGTTSRYHRTRDALMTAAVQRLVDYELETFMRWREGVPEHAPVTSDGLIKILTATFSHWLSRKTQQVARYELSLESQRRPAVYSAIMDARRTIYEIVQGLLEAAGFPRPQAQAATILSALDGFCHHYVLGLEYAVDPRDVEGIVRRLLSVELAASPGDYVS